MSVHALHELMFYMMAIESSAITFSHPIHSQITLPQAKSNEIGLIRFLSWSWAV